MRATVSLLKWFSLWVHSMCESEKWMTLYVQTWPTGGLCTLRTVTLPALHNELDDLWPSGVQPGPRPARMLFSMYSVSGLPSTANIGSWPLPRSQVQAEAPCAQGEQRLVCGHPYRPMHSWAGLCMPTHCPAQCLETKPESQIPGFLRKNIKSKDSV